MRLIKNEKEYHHCPECGLSVDQVKDEVESILSEVGGESVKQLGILRKLKRQNNVMFFIFLATSIAHLVLMFNKIF